MDEGEIISQFHEYDDTSDNEYEALHNIHSNTNKDEDDEPILHTLQSTQKTNPYRISKNVLNILNSIEIPTIEEHPPLSNSKQLELLKEPTYTTFIENDNYEEMIEVLSMIQHNKTNNHIIDFLQKKSKGIPLMYRIEELENEIMSCYQKAIEIETPVMSEEGVFECRKCKSKKTHSFQAQTRSMDEASTTFITCLKCGAKWVM
jgi:DNA-directed RNA polymerase subunit M/transcription elongation factor TFIIS